MGPYFVADRISLAASGRLGCLALACVPVSSRRLVLNNLRQVLQDGLGRVVSGGSGDLPAGMGTATAQVQPLDGRTVGHATSEYLTRCHVYVTDVSVGHSLPGLNVFRGLGSPVDYRAAEVGGVLGEVAVERVDDVDAVDEAVLDPIEEELGLIGGVDDPVDLPDADEDR